MKAAAMLLALAACSELHAQPDYAQAVSAAQQRMHDRFGALRRAEEALVASDLERVHAEARTLMTLDEPTALAEYKPYFETLRDGAQTLGQARDLQAAGRMIAELGRRCASCHQSTHAKIPLGALPQPGSDAKRASQMLRHQWAALRMWEGLIVPSQERWAEGAKLLADAPLTITAESSALGIEDDVAGVRLIARRALDPRADRPTVYGDLLARCVHCHAVIRDR